MNNLMICLPASVKLAEIAEALSTLDVVVPDRDSLAVGVGPDGVRLLVDTDRELDSEYTADQLALIADLVGPYTGLILPYHGLDTAKRIAGALAARFPCVVDTDWTFFGSGEEFLARLAADPDWDWWVGADEDG